MVGFSGMRKKINKKINAPGGTAQKVIAYLAVTGEGYLGSNVGGPFRQIVPTQKVKVPSIRTKPQISAS